MQKNSVHPNSRHAFQRSRIALRQRRLNEAQGVRNRVRSAKGTLSRSPSRPHHGLCPALVG